MNEESAVSEVTFIIPSRYEPDFMRGNKVGMKSRQRLEINFEAGFGREASDRALDFALTLKRFPNMERKIAIEARVGRVLDYVRMAMPPHEIRSPYDLFAHHDDLDDDRAGFGYFLLGMLAEPIEERFRPRVSNARKESLPLPLLVY